MGESPGPRSVLPIRHDAPAASPLPRSTVIDAADRSAPLQPLKAASTEVASCGTASDLNEAVRNLRALILAGEHYRQAASDATGLGTTESQALSYLAVHGDTGQSVLARDLGLTSSASTALVDRLERQGVAQRVRHPRDRRRLIIRLTERGRAVVDESQHWLAATLMQIDPEELGCVSRWLAFLAGDIRERTNQRQAEGWGRTRALPA